uniref:Uncharacterized protein n=1 Tax=Cannabis sativa TaxID=3483 RepID=A0A803QDX0_CANSA
MHRTAPTQLFLNHAHVFSGYKKEYLNVGDLVTISNCQRAKLILEGQSVEDFNLSKVICPNARNPRSEKALKADIISTVEDKYNNKTHGQPTGHEEEEEIPPLDRKRKGVVSLPEPSKNPRRSITPDPRSDFNIPTEAKDFLATQAILLTSAYPDEDRAGHISKTLIDQGFIVLELGGMDGVLRKLGESENQMETLHNDTLDLLNAQEEIQGLMVKLKTLEELHKTDLETVVSMSAELKELRKFWEQTQREATKGAGEALLTPVTYKHCVKHFEDGVFMCWKLNKFEPRLHFMPDPEDTVVRFWERTRSWRRPWLSGWALDFLQELIN